jgi:hypothetical protein
MKEVIELKIEENESTRQLKSGDEIYFSPASSKALYNQIGVIKHLSGQLCVIDSQLFCEQVSYSVIGQGTKLNLYREFKKEELISIGSVTTRYFEQVKKGDWKIEKELASNTSKTVVSNIILSDKGKDFLVLGLKPLSMDDKWFLYFDNNILHGIRSWTGHEVFKCHFNFHNTQWTINRVEISDDWLETLETKMSTIESLIKTRLSTMTKLEVE